MINLWNFGMQKYSILVLCFSLGACSSASVPTDSNVIADIVASASELNTGEANDADGFSADTGDTLGVNVGELMELENQSVTVTGSGQIDTINNETKTDISINGSNHTINIESDVGMLTVSSANSIVRFADNVTVDVCNVGGTDNTAERGENVTLTCTVFGSGNLGFE